MAMREGEQVRAAREKKGLSVEETAERIGMEPKRLMEIEACEDIADLLEIAMLMAFLGFYLVAPAMTIAEYLPGNF